MICELFLVALLWGCSNPFIKAASKSTGNIRHSANYKNASSIARYFLDLKALLKSPTLLISVLVNLSGSLLFVHALRDASI